MRQLDDDKLVAFDFETSGVLDEYALQPWRCPWDASWATSVSVIRRQVVDGVLKLAPDGSSLFFHMDREIPERWSYGQVQEHLRSVLQKAIDNDWIVVGWNVVFDLGWLFAYGLCDLVHKIRWLDGMLLWRHRWIEPEYELDRSKKKSYSLKAAVPEFMPVEHHGYELDIDFHTNDPIALRKLQRYNDRDSVYTWVMTKVLWDELTDRQRNAALIESECLSMVAEANFRGMPVDTLYARELSARLKKTATDLLEQLAPHGVTEKIVRSPTQLGKLLFDEWKLPVLKENTGKKTGKVSRATDKEVLHELAFVDPRAKQLREYREALNNDTKFAETPLISAEYNSDGQTRPQAIVFGTYSGRMTYASNQGKGVNTKQTGFALHQEKRGKDFRSIIIAPEGYSLLEVDAAGQEFRWMAIKSGDPAMLQLCQPGEDAHSYMAARIVGQDYRELVAKVKAEDKDAGNNRYLGKVANLCVAEGTTILTDRGPCSVEQVRDDDLVWDGAKFVAHDGVSFSGVRPVITYMGVTATLNHKVLLANGRWEEIEAAARHGWRIEPALGQRWSHRARSAVRIVDGLVRRAVRERRRAWDRMSLCVCQSWGRLRHGAPTAPGLSQARHRPNEQRWSLRAWKLALGYARGEPCQSRQVRTYDITNCGPNTRFAANGLIVHNSLQYRTYPKTFRRVARVQYNIPMELPEAQRIHRTYQQTYAKVPDYWESSIQLVRRAGYAETLAGRRVQVVGNWDGSFGWQMASTAINYPVQGTGADQKYLAFKILKDYILSIQAYFAWDLHDGIYIWVPTDKLEIAARDISKLLANLPYRAAWDFIPPIPLPWDVKIGSGWGGLKEWVG